MLRKYVIIRICLILFLGVSLLFMAFTLDNYYGSSMASTVNGIEENTENTDDNYDDNMEVETETAEEIEGIDNSSQMMEENEIKEVQNGLKRSEFDESYLEQIAQNSFFVSPEEEKEEPEEEEPETEPEPEPDPDPEPQEEVPELSNPFQLRAVSDHVTEKRAIIYNSEEYQTYIIKIGDEVDGYRVVSIGEDVVVMEKNDQEIKVEF